MASDGTLLGPFNPLLFSPTISSAMLGVFRTDKANTSLAPRVHELIILTVGAACRADYEVYAHTAIGAVAGLPQTTISAIIAGTRPIFDSEDEESAHDFTWQLTRTHRVDDATYARAANIFGPEGLVDIVMLIGLYLTVCAIVNAFDIPVPEDPDADSLAIGASD
jgi:4-carboxymuconolactone decarboxylase